MQGKEENKIEFIVRRISASEFEIDDGRQLDKPEEKTEKSEQPLLPRQSVIRKAPPATKMAESSPGKRRRTEGNAPSVILIRDAIMFRIVDILMWKVIGENHLRGFGYPYAATHQVLWRILSQNAKPEVMPQDHDCGGNVACFAVHVRKFIEIFAPDLWKAASRSKMSVEGILRKIYREDLIPYLRTVDLRNSIDVLQCHSDIVLLEKWEKQKFTAVTWSGQKYFSQISVNCPKCPQCGNRHF